MSSNTSSRAWFLLKYLLATPLGAQWLAPCVLGLFAASYVWRNYWGGQQDSIFFQVLSLGALWYVYLFGVTRTLYELRNNSNSFLVDDIKKISYWMGLLPCLCIYGITSIFLEQFGFAGGVVFFVLMQPTIFWSRRWHKWSDVVRLNMAGLIPFLFINIYLMVNKTSPISDLWLLVVASIASLFSLAIFFSHYKGWINNPRNIIFLDVDITKNS
ncbi:hypothetical protein [Cellvibrio zantedeschiae]|uniref:hypothetical protein n=1 Tax=Cellvibrio zantedeschiae TaxID=1237077 RepID=UPI001674B5CB|nr:hypothetical protein [Cellvibrio zantedeschiae]